MAVVNAVSNPRSEFCVDPVQIQKIKIAMMDTFDRLVEEDLEMERVVSNGRKSRRKPPQPSIRRLIREMPFKVNEKLATDIRKQLVESGELPKPLRGNPNAAEEGASHAAPEIEEAEVVVARGMVLEESILACGAIHEMHHPSWRFREEMIQRADRLRRGFEVPVSWKTKPGQSCKEVAQSSVKAYKAAWKSIKIYAKKYEFYKNLQDFWWNPES